MSRPGGRHTDRIESCSGTGPLDNVLGHLYRPGDGKTFDGVIGKDLSNPIPGRAEHGTDRKVVPYGITAGMDSPNPDSGEEWYTPAPSCSAPSMTTTGARSARP